MISVVHNWWITSFHKLLLSPSEMWGASLVLGRGASRLCSRRAPGRWRNRPIGQCNLMSWLLQWKHVKSPVGHSRSGGHYQNREAWTKWGKKDQIRRALGGEETARILTLRFIVFLFSFSMYDIMLEVWKSLWKFSNCQECWRRNRVMLELTWQCFLPWPNARFQCHWAGWVK